jgi:hypothetical protein
MVDPVVGIIHHQGMGDIGDGAGNGERGKVQGRGLHRSGEHLRVIQRIIFTEYAIEFSLR